MEKQEILERRETYIKLLLEFDVFADLIDVPQHIVEKREYYKKKFLNWLYHPKSKHRFRENAVDLSGVKFTVMNYRSDAFVEWLNAKVLKDSEHKAYVIVQDVNNYEQLLNEGVPSIFF